MSYDFSSVIKQWLWSHLTGKFAPFLVYVHDIVCDLELRQVSDIQKIGWPAHPYKPFVSI